MPVIWDAVMSLWWGMYAWHCHDPIPPAPSTLWKLIISLDSEWFLFQGVHMQHIRIRILVMAWHLIITIFWINVDLVSTRLIFVGDNRSQWPIYTASDLENKWAHPHQQARHKVPIWGCLSMSLSCQSPLIKGFRLNHQDIAYNHYSMWDALFSHMTCSVRYCVMI